MKESLTLEQTTDCKASFSENERYQDMTGTFMFSIVETRPDIAFITSIASRFAKNPGYQHTKVVKTILRYLKGSRKRGITYSSQSKLLVEGYLDSDLAGDKKNRKSTCGFIYMFYKGPIS